MEVRALFRVPSGIGAPSVFVVSASRSPAPPVRALCGFLRACRSHAGGSARGNRSSTSYGRVVREGGATMYPPSPLISNFLVENLDCW